MEHHYNHTHSGRCQTGAHGHHGHGHGHQSRAGTALYWAVGLNLALSLVHFIGGIKADSLALFADGFHNLTDVGALAVAAYAQKLSRRAADERFTFGYSRAETVGALVNSTFLMALTLILFVEAFSRLNAVPEVKGSIVTIISLIALAVDLFTLTLLWRGRNDGLNMRAAFVHSVSDAATSVAVLATGLAIIFYGLYWLDLVATFLVGSYVFIHGLHLFKESVRLLMGAVPHSLSLSAVISALGKVEDVRSIHHPHLWQISENENSFEAHVRIDPVHLEKMDLMRAEMRSILRNQFAIKHSTLEFETLDHCESDHHHKEA